MKSLIEDFELDFTTVCKNGSPLIMCADKGFDEGIKYLTEVKGLDINQTDNDGNNCIYVATFKGHIDTV